MRSTPRLRQGLKRIRPSYLILLTALPFVIYLFATVESYQRALSFIAPGLGTTLLVAVLGYAVACLLGLSLAGLLLLKLGRLTLLLFGFAALVLMVVSAFFFTRPQADYSLVGEPTGRVAIIRGTPARLSELIRTGVFVPDSEPTPLAVRAVESPEAALERLVGGQVNAAFLPTALAPADQPVLWQVRFLPDSARNPALASLVLAVVLALLTFGALYSGHHPLAIFAELYIDMMRGIPMLVIILYVGFPLQAAIRDASGGLIDMALLTRGVIGLSLGYAAYLAEIFRAGIEAVPKGQIEAARSLGLSGWQTARFVVLPQALRIVMPPLGNEFIAMLKDTSLLSVLAIRDITQRTREFSAATFQVFPPFNTVAILYIGLTLAASSLLKWLERRTKRGL